MAKEETAYDVLRPFISIINLYGVNWRSEKRIGWRVVKFINATWWAFALSVIAVYFVFDVYGEHREHAGSVIYTVNALTLFTCLYQWREMEDLVGQLKTSRVDQTSKQTQRMKRWAKVFSIYLYSFIPTVLVLSATMCSMIFVSDGMTLLDVLGDLTMFAQFVATVILTLAALFASAFVIFVPFFLCFVAFYISAAIDDSVQRVKQCKSPLRRGKAFTGLMNSYVQLSRMTTTADQLASIVMHMFKLGAMIAFLHTSRIFAQCLLGLRSKTPVYAAGLLFGCGLTVILLYSFYLRFASFINSKVSFLMYELAKVWLKDDQQLSCDQVSRFHLLEVRLNQLIELQHVMIVESASLTFMGEPVDGESLFTLCAEIVDTANTMYSI